MKKSCAFNPWVTCVFFILPILLSAQEANRPCPDCSQTVYEINNKINDFNKTLRQTKDLKSYSPSDYPVIIWSDPILDSGLDQGKSLYFQRLEAKHNYLESKTRLEKIAGILKRLEEEIREEQASLVQEPSLERKNNLRRLRQLAENQSLIIEELKLQLEYIYKKFMELDKQLAAHEERINAFEGDLSQLSEDLQELAERTSAHAVTSNATSFDGIQGFLNENQSNVGPKRLWKFPRTELRYEETSYDTVEITTSVEGTLFGLVKGEAKGGLVFDTRFSMATYVVGPGNDPLLTQYGATTRETILFCTVSKSFTLKGFGSIKGSAGVNLGVVKSETGVKYETGETIVVSSKRYSPFYAVSQGQTYKTQIQKCREYVNSLKDTEALDREIAAMIRITQIPESTCYNDYDCRRDVSLGILLPSVIAQCFTVKNRQKAVCRHRYVNTNGTHCSLPGEAVYNFKYYCAKGYVCVPETRKCKKIKNRKQILSEAGIEEALPVDLKAHFLIIGPQHPEATGARYCKMFGKTPGDENWKLPTRQQLPAVAEWFRDWARDNIRQNHKNISAQSWFYPHQTHKGFIWSDGPWVYLQANDSIARYNPLEEITMLQFTDPKTQEEIHEGIAICVKNKTP